MKKIAIVFLGLLLFSCNKNKPQEPTISIEEKENKLVEEKFASINKSEVDEYPSFKQCLDTLTKEQKLNCFEENMSNLYKEALNKHKLAIGDTLKATVQVYLKIDNEGKIIFEKTSSSSEKLTELLPSLDSILSSETSNFENIIPAKKNEVNIGTQCVLPLVIDVK
ncbi:MAG: hypothetical protein Q3983_08405 [Capnocytophaga sp.]|nr:hypothetical protein [Capnocytophaga sp.]